MSTTVPAGTPYERQLLLQCVQRTAARWGGARITVGRREVLVVAGVQVGAGRCARCQRQVGLLRCDEPTAPRCLPCALDVVLADGCAAVTIALPTVTAAGPLAERVPHREHHSIRADAPRSSIAQHRQ